MKFNRTLLSGALILCFVLAAAQWVAAGESGEAGRYVVLVDPDNSLSFAILHGAPGREQSIAHVGLVGWGPSWAWTSVESKEKPNGSFDVSAPFVVNRNAGQGDRSAFARAADR